MSVDFVKGEMGGNRIVLLDGRQIPRPEVLKAALEVLNDSDPPGHQAGLLYPSANPDSLRVRVVSVSWRDFIPACGGLTQVLGKALVEAGLGERFDLPLAGETAQVTLEFDAWPVTLQIHRRKTRSDRVERVAANLTPFLNECRDLGIGTVDLDGIEAGQVGTFLVLDADHLRTRYCDVDFEHLSDAARALLIQLQRRFHQQVGFASWDFALFDRHPKRGGHARAVFPHRLNIDHVEPSCGTGSAALAVHLAETADPRPQSQRVLLLETGGGAELGGPDLTTVALGLEGGRVQSVAFHHDNVTLTEEGQTSYSGQ